MSTARVVLMAMLLATSAHSACTGDGGPSTDRPVASERDAFLLVVLPGIGIDERAPFRVLRLSRPGRVAVDVATS